VTRRPAARAALAVVLVIVGQLLALTHEADAKHVTCAAHGELLDAPDVHIGQDDGCGQSHFLAVDGDGVAHHEDCVIGRLLRTSTRASDFALVLTAATSIADVHHVALLVVASAVDVILIAPKTSPPVLR